MVSVLAHPRAAVLERHDRRLPHRAAVAERAAGLRLAARVRGDHQRRAARAGARGSRSAVVAVGRAPRRRTATVPGIVVGQQLASCPTSAAYELYLAYDLGDASQTLGFVHGHAVDRRRRARAAHQRHRVVRAAIGDDPDRRGGRHQRQARRGRAERAAPGARRGRAGDPRPIVQRDGGQHRVADQGARRPLARAAAVRLGCLARAAHAADDHPPRRRHDQRPARRLRSGDGAGGRAAQRAGAAVRDAADRPARDQPLRRRLGAARARAHEPRPPRRRRDRLDAAARRPARHRRAPRRARRLLPGRHGPASRPPGRAQPARQRDRARRGAPDRRHRRQRPAGRRARRARLRARHDARRTWSASSTASGGPTRRARGRSAARDSGCRSRSATRGCTAASSRSGRSSAAARTSC